METNSLSKQSQRLVEFLKEEKEMSIPNIVKFVGTTPTYLAMVVRGERVFQERHFESMQKNNPGLFAEFVPYLAKKVVGSLAKKGGDAVRGKVDPAMKKICNFLGGLLD